MITSVATPAFLITSDTTPEFRITSDVTPAFLITSDATPEAAPDASLLSPKLFFRDEQLE